MPVFSSVGTFPWTWRLFVICPFLSSFRLWLLLGLVLVLTAAGVDAVAGAMTSDVLKEILAAEPVNVRQKKTLKALK